MEKERDWGWGAYNREMRTLSFWNTMTTMFTTVTAIYVAN